MSAASASSDVAPMDTVPASVKICAQVARAMAKWEQQEAKKRYDTLPEMHIHMANCSKRVVECDTLSLAERNKLDSDAGAVATEEPHAYFLCANKKSEKRSKFVMSVTKLIGLWFSPFDRDIAARSVFNGAKYRRGFGDSRYEYFDCTKPEHLFAKWDQNREDGKLLHNQIELFMNLGPDRQLQFKCHPRVKTGFDQLMRMMNSSDHWLWDDYQIFRTEPVGWNLKLLIAGRPDLLLRSLVFPNEIVIIDWKRMPTIATTAYRDKRAFGVLSELPDCKMSVYQLQLNWYKKLVEEQTDFKVVGMFIIQLHPSFGKDAMPLVHEVPDMKQYIDKMAAARAQQLRKLSM